MFLSLRNPAELRCNRVGMPILVCLLALGLAMSGVALVPGGHLSDAAAKAKKKRKRGKRAMRGPRGVRGPRGKQGLPGEQGSSGAQGSQGQSGAQGPLGPIGPQGPQGATGAQGPAGPKGATGNQGPAGPKGATGTTGNAGPEGATGPQGATGATGPKGPAGKGAIGGAIAYSFDAATEFADPGSGKLRLNSVSPGEVTGLFINETDADGANVEPWLDTSVESTGTPPSYLTIRSESEPQNFHIFEVKAITLDLGEYSLFEVGYVAGKGGFSEGEPLALQLSRTGDDGVGSLPYTDYGLVTSLPASPNVGDRCIFKASGSVFWQLVYDGEGSYPWKKIGGPPLETRTDEMRTVTNQTTYTNFTVYISLTTPLGGDYDIEVGAMLDTDGTGGGYISYTVGETKASDAWAARFKTEGSAGDANVSKIRKHSGISKGAVVKENVRTDGPEQIDIVYRYLRIDPIRVG